jgi:hypothetical protein
VEPIEEPRTGTAALAGRLHTVALARESELAASLLRLVDSETSSRVTGQ